MKWKIIFMSKKWDNTQWIILLENESISLNSNNINFEAQKSIFVLWSKTFIGSINDLRTNI